ncbi:hypothetical protein C2W62_26885 [Candidatus Entotheonella serta]|nr:hypothetical protein C2W62_26885 [Candidatus Entotheonella serta]
MEPERQQQLLNTEATAARLRHVCAELQLSPEGFKRAFELAGYTRQSTDWQRFLNRVLLVLGAALIVIGTAAFFAYNWSEMHRFDKFATLQGLLVAAVTLTWWHGADSLIVKAGLLAAAFSVGVLLAVYGQAYQTGADPYSLFLGWMMLILLWAIAGRQAELWLFVAILANLTLVLYWIQVLHPPERWTQDLSRTFGPGAWLLYALSDFLLAQLVFGLNAVFLIVWEGLARRPVRWLTGRGAPRLLGLFAQMAIGTATLRVIFFGIHDVGTPLVYASPVLFVAFTLLALWYYQRRYRDLLILAMCASGIIVMTTSLLARGLHFSTAGKLFLLGLFVVAQTGAAAMWLHKVFNSWRATT